MSIFHELKRRNVFRIGAAYIVAGWVLVEVADILLPTFDAPEWAMRAVVLTVVIGLPFALLFAWMFELTPEGVKREDGVVTVEKVQFGARTGRKLDVVIIVVLGLAVSYFVLEKIWLSDAVRGDHLRSIAVLPFTDMSLERDQEYFAEGLAVELLNTLSRKTDLKVTGRTSAFQFKNHEGDFRTIGKTLGVGSILEGSVRADDNSIRIAIQLVDADEGHTLWSENYDRPLTNIFQAQDEIALAVVKALNAKFLEGEATLSRRKVNAEAYKAHQQGTYLQGSATVDSQNQSIVYFNRAREIDPTFAEPLVGLANANLTLALNMSEIDRNLGFSRADGFVDEALRLNPSQADAYVARALIKQIRSRDYVGAEIDLKRAVEIDPHNITALRRLGTIHGYYGRYDKAMDAFQAIVDQDPLNTQTYSNYSMNALAAGDLGLAERMITKVLEFKPDSTYAHYQLSRVLLAKGDIAGAKAANEREALPIWRTIGDGMIACKEGDHDRAVEIAEGLIEQHEVFNAAEIYGLCGDSEKVFELLERAADDGDPALIEMKLSWQLAHLRDDPRWHQVLKKIGLPI